MASFKLEIVTAERLVLSEEVNLLVAPGVEGQLGILPHHAPLMTMLEPGELMIRKGEEEIYWAIGGGFIEVRLDKVIVLADACEQATEIDVERAEAAKKRAETIIKTQAPNVDMAVAEASLRRALVRLKVADRRRHKYNKPT
ncbi:MAG: F0F1 ATP synthase subunit epsilon [Candidatus Stahlbacteria bacterium]|nr:F0F1 ATP synthase subunit epsilon [Candidatus Stahlbacteria bacterium]